MTRIATMRGVKAVLTAPKNLYFDYSRYTEGELQLLFMREKAKLLQTFYPDSNLYGQWENAINRINNAVYKGLANFQFTGLWDNEEKQVAEAISFLKSKTNPANKTFLSERRNASIGTDPLIPLEDAYESCKVYQYGNFGTSYDSCVRKVEEANYYKRMLNDPSKGLEKSSHQFLYNWTTQADLENDNLPFENRYKMRTHKEHITELAKITGLSSMNLAGWVSLGIMRQSAYRLGQVMTAEETIAFLKANTDTPILDVNDPRAAELGELITLIAIAVLVLASFIGVSGLIQVCKGKEPTAFKYISSLSTLTNSPGGTDWKTKAGDILTGGGDTTSNPCPTGYTRNALGVCVPKVATTTGNSGLSFSDPLVIGGGAAILAAGLFIASK